MNPNTRRSVPIVCLIHPMYLANWQIHADAADSEE